MTRYTAQGAEDMWLADWWATVTRTGELADMVPAHARGLSGWMRYFGAAELLWDVDDNGVREAVWAQPWMGTAWVGVYVRPDRRASRAAYRAICEALEAFLGHWPLLLNLVALPRLETAYSRLGWVYAGVIPGLWDGKDVAIMRLTRASWAARRARNPLAMAKTGGT